MATMDDTQHTQHTHTHTHWTLNLLAGCPAFAPYFFTFHTFVNRLWEVRKHGTHAKANSFVFSSLVCAPLLRRTSNQTRAPAAIFPPAVAVAETARSPPPESRGCRYLSSHWPELPCLEKARKIKIAMEMKAIEKQFNEFEINEDLKNE